MPHLMNCPHMDDGWCLDCVVEQWQELQNVIARAEAAEAECERLRQELAELRQIAQLALDGVGDTQIVYAPLLLQALQDIASEVADD